jgi:hypothetical protein
MPVTFTTTLDTTRSTTSHSAVLDSTSIRIIDLLESVSSHSSAKNSSSLRLVDLLKNVDSYSTSISAAVERNVDLLASVNSYSNLINSSSVGIIDVGYDVNSQFSSFKDWELTHGDFVTDRVYKGSNSYYSNVNKNKQAEWTPFDTGKQVGSFTYYYQEVGSSYGSGVRLVNSDGNYEGGTATDNDEYDVDFANTTGHQYNPNHGYNLWVKVHWDFDWDNNEVTVTFEKLDGTNSYTGTYTLKEGVDIESVELWNYHSGTWGGGKLNAWWNGLQFTQDQNIIAETLTGAFTSKTQRLIDLIEGVNSYNSLSSSNSIRTVDLLEEVSSYSTANGSDSIRIIDIGNNVDSHSTSASSSSKILTSLIAAVQSHSAVAGSDTLRVVDLAEAVTSFSSPMETGSQAIIDLLVEIDSHSKVADSSVESLISLLVGALSVSKSVGSENQRDGINYENREKTSTANLLSSSSSTVIDLMEGVESHTAISGAAANRDGLNFIARDSNSFSRYSDSDSIRIIDLLEQVNSHSGKNRSFSYNERTSLELIDHEVYWDDDEAFWYTNWFKESKLLGSEDTLAIRSLVVPESKKPAAIVCVQYDGDGNGTVDAESDHIELGSEQEVQEVTGVPVDEEGHYRIKIMEYSGYNSVYSIDTAIVN